MDLMKKKKKKKKRRREEEVFLGWEELILGKRKQR